MQSRIPFFNNIDLLSKVLRAISNKQSQIAMILLGSVLKTIPYLKKYSGRLG